MSNFFNRSNLLKLTATAAAVFAYNSSVAADTNEAAQDAAKKAAESQIYNLNANFNNFETGRDYENFIQSRSKLLKRNANDDLRDVDVNAQPVDENSIQIDSFTIDSEGGFNPRLVAKLEALANQYKGQNFNARKIAALKNNLNNILIRDGYSTSIIYVPEGAYDRDTKALKFNLKWGLVNAVRVADNQEDRDSFKNRAMLTTLPGFSGDVLRLSTIDQIVDNLTTPNKDVRIDVAATPDRKGYSDVIINSYRTVKPSFSLSLNNANDKGQVAAVFTATAGDLIGTNDTWTLSYNKRLINRTNERHTDIVSLRLDQPLGFFQLSINNTLVSYKNTVAGNAAKYKVYGPSFKTDWKLSYVAFRDQTRVANLFAGVTYKTGHTDVAFVNNSGNRTAQIVFTPNKTSDFRLGANFLNNAFYGGRLFVEGYYTQGWGLFSSDKSAKVDDKNVYQDYAKTLNFYVNYNRNLFLGNTLFNSSTTVQAQKALTSGNAGSYQVSFGDAYSVRGLREQGIQGDDGFLVTTTFGPLFQLDNKWLRTINPYFGLDYAVTHKLANGSEKAYNESAASANLGLSISGSHYRASLNVGTPFAVNLKDKEQQNKVSKVQLYFNVSTNF